MKMKKLIFSALLGLAMVAFTGCTSGNDAETEAKCSASSKCDGAKKCDASKTAKKCDSSGKCGK